MEGPANFEQRERDIDDRVSNIEREAGMQPGHMLLDIALFAPYEGNEQVNLEYLSEVAGMLGISVEEMHQYAVKKAKELA